MCEQPPKFVHALLEYRLQEHGDRKYYRRNHNPMGDDNARRRREIGRLAFESSPEAKDRLAVGSVSGSTQVGKTHLVFGIILEGGKSLSKLCSGKTGIRQLLPC